MIAEFVALIPKIFSLENKESEAEDGGATGLWGILWPLFFFFGFVSIDLILV